MYYFLMYHLLCGSLLGQGGTKVFINGPGLMDKMVAVPIYNKYFKQISSGTGGPISTKLGI